MEKIKAVFFDFDGVIVDSLSFWENLFNKVIKTYQLDATPLLKNDGINFTTHEAIEIMLQHQQRFTKHLYQDIIHWTEKFYTDNFHDHIKLNEQAIDVLKTLKSNHIQIILVSNSSRQQIDYAFQEFNLSNYFDDTISADDVKKGKPNPEGYLKALEKKNRLKNEVIIIEDSTTGIQTAKNAGINCLIYKNENYVNEKNYIDNLNDIYKLIEIKT